MNRYIQVKKIGAGSFGTAYLCKTRSSGESVVIKKIDIAEMSESDKANVRKEASLLAHLKHPYIIHHIESFEEEGELCIVTEYAERGDLNARLEERKGVWMPENQVLSYYTQCCLALLYLHKRKILHRDLKLANLFLSLSNDIRLGDFGIARILKATMECAKTVVGTPYYLSPEICKSKPYNHKSDVWSTGCILYELCSQHHPFEGSSITSLVRRILRGTYAPLPDAYSPQLKDLLGSLLQLKPGMRPSMSHILAQPLLQPFVRDFAAKCARSGTPLPFLDSIIETPLLVGPISSSSSSSAAGGGGDAKHVAIVTSNSSAAAAAAAVVVVGGGAERRRSVIAAHAGAGVLGAAAVAVAAVMEGKGGPFLPASHAPNIAAAAARPLMPSSGAVAAKELGGGGAEGGGGGPRGALNPLKKAAPLPPPAEAGGPEREKPLFWPPAPPPQPPRGDQRGDASAIMRREEEGGVAVPPPLPLLLPPSPPHPLPPPLSPSPPPPPLPLLLWPLLPPSEREGRGQGVKEGVARALASLEEDTVLVPSTRGHSPLPHPSLPCWRESPPPLLPGKRDLHLRL